MTKPKFQGKYRVESIRLQNRDYAANGSYFVTICTKKRVHFFGNVVAGEMQLSPMGEIAQQFWGDIPQHFDHTYIDAYVIMPNHIHGIIVINRPDQPNHTKTLQRDVETLHCNVSTISDDRHVTPSVIRQRRFMSHISPKAGALGTIIRSYKSAVTRQSRDNGFNIFQWQERFYEHIIRADGSLDRIRRYIINNPRKWERDKNNFMNLWM